MLLPFGKEHLSQGRKNFLPVGIQTRILRMKRYVYPGNVPFSFFYKPKHFLQEEKALNVTIPFFRGGKKVAQVGKPRSSQQSVTYRMGDKIRVGMSSKPQGGRNAHSSENEWPSRNKGVHVESVSCTHFLRALQKCPSQLHFLGIGDFEITGIPLKKAEFLSFALPKLSLVETGRSSFEKLQEFLPGKALGGLGTPKKSPIHAGSHQVFLGAHFLEGLRTGKQGNYSQGLRRRSHLRHNAKTEILREKGPSSIVNKHELPPGGLHSPAHRIGSLRPSGDHRTLQRSASQGRFHAPHAFFGYYQHKLVNFSSSPEPGSRLQTPEPERFFPEKAKLFGLSTHATAPAACHKDKAPGIPIPHDEVGRKSFFPQRFEAWK
jgi:hypothetical protein